MKKIIFLLFYLNSGCMNSQIKSIDTPEDFKNKHQISTLIYSFDSTLMVKDLSKMIKKHKDGFYPYTPLWVDTTKSEVIIDTIVFNDSMNKAFILLSAKSLYWHRHKTVNGVFKDIGKAFVFDGYGLLAKKNNNNWTYKAYEVQSTLFNNKSDCFERLREIYFHELSIWHPYNDIHYNIDDKRIWNQSIWENF